MQPTVMNVLAKLIEVVEVLVFNAAKDFFLNTVLPWLIEMGKRFMQKVWDALTEFVERHPGVSDSLLWVWTALAAALGLEYDIEPRIEYEQHAANDEEWDTVIRFRRA